MATTKSTYAFVSTIILLFVISSCGPKINTFEAIPRNVCAGKEVIVSWDVAGMGYVSSDPYDKNNGPIPQKDSILFTPIEDTNYEIRAWKNNKQTPINEQYVYVLNDGEEISIGGTANLIGNRLEAIIDHKYQEWGDLKIDNLNNPYDQSLWILYNSEEIEIPVNPKNCKDIMEKPSYCLEYKISDIQQIYILLNNEELNNPDLQPNILQTTGYAICN